MATHQRPPASPDRVARQRAPHSRRGSREKTRRSRGPPNRSPRAFLRQRPAEAQTNVAPGAQQDRAADWPAEVDERVDAHARWKPPSIAAAKQLGCVAAPEAGGREADRAWLR